MGALLELRDLAVEFMRGDRVAQVVRGISYRVEEGETLGIVGESGSGKSVHVLAMLGLMPSPPGRVAGGLPHALRAGLACRMARMLGDANAVAHYQSMLGGGDGALAEPGTTVDDPRIAAILRHADLLTRAPMDATRADIDALRAAGVVEADIVRLAELAAFVNYQLRVTAGLRLLQGSGRMTRVVHEFTAEPLIWRPYVTPIVLEDATPAQREALQETPSNTKVSDYVLVLAHDPESLLPRTRLFNAIMYGRGGLARAERELGATAASIVNRCVYCAAVHAARYNQLARKPEVIERLFAEREAVVDPDPRRRAIIGFSLKLSRCPPDVAPADIAALRAAGLGDAEILDLVLSVAIFGWANRLMHTLGEPTAPETAGA